MVSMTPLQAAINLASHGLAAFPCLLDKRPACPHGFKDARTDADVVRSLWQRYPGALVGLATGVTSVKQV